MFWLVYSLTCLLIKSKNYIVNVSPEPKPFALKPDLSYIGKHTVVGETASRGYNISQHDIDHYRLSMSVPASQQKWRNDVHSYGRLCPATSQFQLDSNKNLLRLAVINTVDQSKIGGYGSALS